MNLEAIEFVLRQQQDLKPQTITNILSDLKKAKEEEDAAARAEREAAGPPLKPYPALLASHCRDDDDTRQLLASLSQSPACFFIVEPVGDIVHADIPARFMAAVHAFNRELDEKRGKAKRRKNRASFMPVKTIGEAVERVSRKHFKAQDLKVRHKLPAIIAVTLNELPETAAWIDPDTNLKVTIGTDAED